MRPRGPRRQRTADVVGVDRRNSGEKGGLEAGSDVRARSALTQSSSAYATRPGRAAASCATVSGAQMSPG